MRIILLTCIFALVASQYGPPPDMPKIFNKDTPVFMINKKNFEEYLFRGHAPVLVFFAKEMDETCMALRDDYETLAQTLGQAIKITAVHGLSEREVTGSFGIEQYPTFVFFGQDKSAPIKYDGEVRITKVAQWALTQLEKMMLTRLGIKTTTGKKKKTNRRREDEPTEEDEAFWDKLEQPDIIELTETNFDEMVLQSEEPWIVQFYTQKSKKSQAVAQIFSDMATEVKKDIKVGKLEASLFRKFAKSWEIEEYPHNKFFPRDKSLVEDFVHEGIPLGGPMADSARDRLKFHDLEIQVPKITSHKEIAEECKKPKSMCVIAVLDDESQTQVLSEQAKLNYNPRIKLFWTPAGTNPEVEELFKVNSPGLVAFNTKKSTYFTMHGEFEDKNIGDFFVGIAGNKFFFQKFEKLPRLNT